MKQARIALLVFLLVVVIIMIRNLSSSNSTPPPVSLNNPKCVSGWLVIGLDKQFYGFCKYVAFQSGGIYGGECYDVPGVKFGHGIVSSMMVKEGSASIISCYNTLSGEGK